MVSCPVLSDKKKFPHSTLLGMHNFVHHVHFCLMPPLCQGLQLELLQPVHVLPLLQARHHAHHFLLDLLQHCLVCLSPWWPSLCAKFWVGAHILCVQPDEHVSVLVVKGPCDLASTACTVLAAFAHWADGFKLQATVTPISFSSLVVSITCPPIENWFLGFFIPMCITLHFLTLNAISQFNVIRTGLGIRSFAHFAQIKWATVSDLLRSLKTNERPWSNRSGRSEKTSEWAIRSTNFGLKNLKSCF